MTVAERLEAHRASRTRKAVSSAVEAVKASPAVQQLTNHVVGLLVAAGALALALGLLLGLILSPRLPSTV